jgi:hypothetical protein
MSDLSFSEMARCSAYGLLVLLVLIGLGYMYPLAQLGLLGAAVAGIAGGFLFGLDYQRSDRREDDDELEYLHAAYVEEVPYLSTEPHEIADPVTRKQVVAMWNVLREKYLKERA